jgi:hypothetical protein
VVRVPIVAVVGHGTVSEGAGAWRLAEILGERLVDAGCPHGGQAQYAAARRGIEGSPGGRWILEVIGKPLDDQLRTEAWNSYTCVDRDEARAMLQKFYDKVDAGRAGGSPTAL